jgi:hypothetical protein
MNSIARELDARLQTLDESTVAESERVVRDAMDLASHQKPTLTEWPIDFFDRIRDETNLLNVRNKVNWKFVRTGNDLASRHECVDSNLETARRDAGERGHESSAV